MGLRKKSKVAKKEKSAKVAKKAKASKASKASKKANGVARNGNGAGKKKTPRRKKSTAEPFPMKLKGMMALKYRALQAEVSEAQAVFKRAQDKVKNEQSKKIHQPLLILLEKQSEAEVELSRRIEALARLQLEIGRKFGIEDAQMHEYVVDPSTGVMLHDPPKEALQKDAS